MILGIDEVGRGPLAGPLVVGAVVLGGASIDGLTDSKKLTKKRREALDVLIREQAWGIGLGWVHADELDSIGLSAALALATRRAVEQIEVAYHEIIIDGTVNFLKDTRKGKFVTTLKKADLLVPCVSAASIVAKVARDAFMTQQHDIYPEYGFKSHVGYGTAAHRAAITKHGVTPLHRRSFMPIQRHTASNTLTSTAIGNEAETAVALYLQQQGHAIVERNWKTKYCEIDIVSEHKGIIYFTEVKYRRTQLQGGGLAAITPLKLRQMRFAAKLYVHSRRLQDTDLRLAAAAASGAPPIVETFLEVS